MQIAEMRLTISRRSLQAKPSTVQARAAVIAQVQRMRRAGGVLSYQFPVDKAMCRYARLYADYKQLSVCPCMAL